MASQSYNDLVNMVENGNEARRQLKDILTPFQKDMMEGFLATGQKPNRPNLLKFLASKGNTGAVDPTIDTLKKNFKLAVSERNGRLASEEIGKRKSIQPKPKITTVKPEERGFTNESGEWQGSRYERIADLENVFPAPKVVAKWLHNLKPGDLIIDHHKIK